MSEAPVVPGADDAAEPEVVVVTGMSGAGRSTVGNVMEDHGWYVIDNLPVSLMPDLLHVSVDRGGDLVGDGRAARIGIVLDVRAQGFETADLGRGGSAEEPRLDPAQRPAEHRRLVEGARRHMDFHHRSQPSAGHASS